MVNYGISSDIVKQIADLKGSLEKAGLKLLVLPSESTNSNSTAGGSGVNQIATKNFNDSHVPVL